jgi:hypothetical protein
VPEPLRIDAKYWGGWSGIPTVIARNVIVLVHPDHWEFLTGGGGRRKTLATLPSTEISSLELGQMTAQHARGFSLATGFLGSGTQIAGTSGFRVTLRDGQVMLLEIQGAPMLIETRLRPLLVRYPAPPPGAAWHPDPTGRHELRYWDASAWTAHVSDGGATAVDPV